MHGPTTRASPLGNGYPIVDVIRVARQIDLSCAVCLWSSE